MYFEFWPTAHPGEVGRSLSKDIPAGATGPISQPNFPFPYGLRVDTEYSFRLCGTDQGAPNGLCAQTRTFRTKRPDGDLVRGFFLTQFTGIGHSGYVTAQSDPSGGNPTGELSLPGDLGNTFTGDVTCMAVDGNEGAVGAVGTTVDGTPASGLLEVRDDTTSSNTDQLRYAVTPNGAPPDCAGASFEGLFGAALSGFAVYDTP